MKTKRTFFVSLKTEAGHHDVSSDRPYRAGADAGDVPQSERVGLVCVRLQSGTSVYNERMTRNEALALASALMRAALELPEAHDVAAWEARSELNR